MAIAFHSRVKGGLTQNLLTSILEHGGYRVTRLGIEELFGEVKHMDVQAYLNLHLPKRLRTLPDLLVATRDLSQAFLVEVKFRKKFSERAARELHQTLTDQRKHWPESWAVIFISEATFPDMRFHQDYMRAVPPGKEDLLLGFEVFKQHASQSFVPMRTTWNSLPTILNPFDKLIDAKICSGMDSITATLRQLAKL